MCCQNPERPGSGENIFIDGLEQWELCVGDVFAIEGSTLSLEVTSSRRVCENWNHVHGLEPYGDGSYYQQPDGVGNVRHWMLRQNLGGFFLRVLADGDLNVGDKLVLASRPHPEWTLKRIGELMYGAAEVDMHGWLQWAGTDEELEEIIALPSWAEAEWKHVMTEHKEGRPSLF